MNDLTNEEMAEHRKFLRELSTELLECERRLSRLKLPKNSSATRARLKLKDLGLALAIEGTEP